MPLSGTTKDSFDVRANGGGGHPRGAGERRGGALRLLMATVAAINGHEHGGYAASVRAWPSAAMASNVDSRVPLRQVRRRSGLPAQRFGEVS